jgi:hypothetical protein
MVIVTGRAGASKSKKGANWKICERSLTATGVRRQVGR